MLEDGRINAEAVDLFDVAAELESTGQAGPDPGGSPNLFHRAALEFVRRQTTQGFAPLKWRPFLIKVWFALWRSLGLLSGVVLVAMFAWSWELDVRVIAAATCLGWIAGQGVSAMCWRRFGRGQLQLGLSMASWWALVVSTLSAIVGLTLVSILGARIDLASVAFIVGMLAYGALTAIVSVTKKSVAANVVICVAAVIVAATQVWAGDFSRVVVAIVDGVVVITLLFIAYSASGRKPLKVHWPEHDDIAVVGAPTLQALFLSVALLQLLGARMYENPLLLVIPPTIAVAVADLSLVTLREVLRLMSTRSRSFVESAIGAAVAAILACAIPIVVAGATCLIMGRNNPGVEDPSVPLALGAVVAYSTTAVLSAGLRSFGAPWFAVLMALLAFAVPWAMTTANTTVIAAATCVIVGVGVALWLRVLSDPRSYL